MTRPQSSDHGPRLDARDALARILTHKKREGPRFVGRHELRAALRAWGMKPGAADLLAEHVWSHVARERDGRREAS